MYIVIKICSFDSRAKKLHFAEVLKNNNQQISVVLVSRYLNGHTHYGFAEVLSWFIRFLSVFLIVNV